MSRKPVNNLYLSPEQEELLLAVLNSNQPLNNSNNQPDSKIQPQPNFTPNMSSAPGSGRLDLSDESPYFDLDPEAEFDDSFDYDDASRMIGDIPGELHDKRKSLGENNEEEDGGGKRRESDDKTSKKPGRKPLTSEPTSKRKAQNRAAQRAFRERKEKHLKDLETKVEDLEKASDSANHENSLLRAQVDRLQVELREYRKRLSSMSTNGPHRAQSASSQSRQSTVNNQNDFQFEFPKFGDIPPMSATNMFSTTGGQPGSAPGVARSSSKPSSVSNSKRESTSELHSGSGTPQQGNTGIGSATRSPPINSLTASPQQTQQVDTGSLDSLSGLFSPSILEASRHASLSGYFPQSNSGAGPNNRTGVDHNGLPNSSRLYSTSSTSNSDSPGSSSESHNAISSIGTSPEPSLNSPANKVADFNNLQPIREENQYPFGGYTDDLGFGSNGVNWLAQQNNNSFDPVLFGDYRDTQDSILSQDFGSFFNDAYPLPDLGSPLHNYNDVTAEQPAAKLDLMKQVDLAKDGEEVVPNNDKPMSCNKIWDRLQSMEKFRNGEIDIDNLCTELRAKAKCSEGGAVVDKTDVDRILAST